MTRRHKQPRWIPVSVRPTEQELERWRRCAVYDAPKLSFSAWLRRTLNEGCDVIEANRRADAATAGRVQKLSRLTPPEIEALRERGGDVGDWPELDSDDEGAP
jgi:hypothetical protein